eukprot:1072461_1
MKRKRAPPTSGRSSKRRKIDIVSPANVRREEENTEMISPLVDVTNHGISPRPAQLITKQIQLKRILSKTKKNISLTDDEAHIIYEEDEEYDEIEVARGKQDLNQEIDIDLEYDEIEVARGKQDLNQEIDIDLEDDPFAVRAPSNHNANKDKYQFESIPEHEMSLDEVLSQQELELSQTLFPSQANQIEMAEIESLNLSLPLTLATSNDDDDSAISAVFKGINISAIERDEEVEEEEKAIVLQDELSHTVSQINDNETLLQIEATPRQQKKYSIRKKQKRIEKEVKRVAQATTNIITTRSRRRMNKKIVILPSEVELTPRTGRRRKRKQSDGRGRSYSLLERFEDKSDNEEDEMRQMILNQSGIEVKRKKRKQMRANKKERKKVKDADFAGVARPAMSQECEDECKNREDELIAFWRDIEAKMKENQFKDDVKRINKENETDLHLKGRRAVTPPRIRKHLARRYRKQYENMTGDVVMDVGKRKGQRVWFLSQKLEILNGEQRQSWNDQMNNSLISVSDNNVERESEIEMDELVLNIADDVSLLSAISKLSDAEDVFSVGSVVSGHCLPSIADLSSIMEEHDGEQQDLDEVDPFDMGAVQEIVQNKNQIQTQSQSSSIEF